MKTKQATTKGIRITTADGSSLRVNATRLAFAISGSNSPHAPSLRRQIRLEIYKTVLGDHFAKVTYTSDFEWEWAPKVSVIPPLGVVENHDRLGGAWSLATLLLELDTNVDPWDLSGLTFSGRNPEDSASVLFQEGEAHVMEIWDDAVKQVSKSYGYVPVGFGSFSGCARPARDAQCEVKGI